MFTQIPVDLLKIYISVLRGKIVFNLINKAFTFIFSAFLEVYIHILFENVNSLKNENLAFLN